MALFDDIFSGANGVAKILVDTFGRDVTYRQWSEISGGYDPITDVTSGGYVTHTITCAPFTAYKKESLADTSVLVGDLKAIVSAVQITWEITDNRDKVSDPITGKLFNVVGHKTVNTGVLDAIYILQLRVAS